jgi:hypothetical protein
MAPESLFAMETLYRMLSIARVGASGPIACVAFAGTVMLALATWSIVFVILAGLALFEARDPRRLMVHPRLRRAVGWPSP